MGQVSVAVLLDKFVAASALIKYEANERAKLERKKREVDSMCVCVCVYIYTYI
jgi:hypothetical protein